MFRHFRNICLVALAAGWLAALAVPVAAAPIDDKRAQARALAAQIEQTQQQLSVLAEQYNAAQLELDAAEAKLGDLEARIAATKAQIAAMKEILRERAAAVYRQSASGQTLQSFDVRNAQELASRERYAAAQSEADNELVDDLDVAKQELGDQRAAARRVRDQAAAVRDELAQTKADLEALDAQQEATLAQVDAEIKELIHEDLERKQAEAAARYGHTVASTNLPPPGPSTAKAIEFAYQQLGKTYVYAAAGPDHYDCSGLTMAAFKAAGVYLPHYSGAQYGMLPHVPLDGMMRGDLIFWGAGGSSHVAIYLGNGQIIESGGTGHDVHVGPIWGHPSGAARVTK